MNVQSIFPIISGLIIIFTGLFVLSKNFKSKLNILFFLECLTLFVWLFGYSRMYATLDKTVALRWARIGYTGIIFIPIFIYHFYLEFLQIKRKKVISSMYLLGLFFLLISHTNFIYQKLDRYFWGWYPRAGLLYPFYVLFFFGVFIRSLILLYTSLKDKEIKLKSNITYNQLKYLLAAFIIASFGGVDYIAKFGIGIYPFGYLAALGWILMVAYAIVKYRLLDINVFISRATIFAFVYTIVLGIPLFLGYRYDLWMYSTWIMLVLATLGPIIYQKLRKRVEDIMLADQRRYQETLRRASQGMTLIKDLNKLLNLIVHMLTKTIRVTHASAYVLDEPNNTYVLKAIRGLPKRDVALSIDANESLIKVLSVRRLPLTFDELKRYLAETTTIYTRFDLERAHKKMRSLSAAIVIPSFIQNRLLGFVILGDKKSATIYTSDDILVLGILANQAALAIENCQFLEELEKARVRMFEIEKFSSMGKMACGMSHQVNNRFYAVSSLADALKSAFLPILTKLLTSEEQFKAAKQIEDVIIEIHQNALHGGDITKTLMDFSKPAQEDFKEIHMTAVIEGALRMVSLKQKLEGIDIIQDIPVWLPNLLGDLHQLQDVYFNLIDNCVDALYTRQSKMKADELPQMLDYKPSVIIKSTLEDAKYIVTTVQDNGIGMTKEEKSQIFNPFFTTKATSQKGTGLGLFIIRKIIENHGGTIEVESEYGKGTTFTIKLPAVKQTEEADKSKGPDDKI